MATILLIWEYKRNASHIARLQCLQKHLIKMGHTTYLMGTCLPFLKEAESLPFLPAPYAAQPSLHRPRSIIKMGGFTDRLALLGFNQVQSLYTLVTAWDHLFDLLKPQLLICDCAPVASLAAYKTIPVIQVSDGLSLPPYNLDNFPRLRPDVPPLAAASELLINVQLVQAKRKKSHIPSLPALFTSEHQFICHIPEFDPYFTFRDKAAQFGPFYAFSEPVIGERDYFFAYLDKDYPDVEEVAISLADMEKTGIFYIPEAPAALLTFLTASGMIIHEHLPAFDHLLTQCAWVIHHGNVPLAEAALAAGIPQFTLPDHFENDLISQILVKLNVAVSLRPDFHPVTMTSQHIQQGYKQHTLREWSSLRAQHLKQKNYAALEQPILAACQQILQ